jgi:hypothetical protein
MPRTKKPESTITEALNTPLEKTIEEAADYLGVAPIRLQELFCDRLQSAEPMVWLTIPTEHEERLEIFKREIDAANSVRRFDYPNRTRRRTTPKLTNCQFKRRHLNPSTVRAATLPRRRQKPLIKGAKPQQKPRREYLTPLLSSRHSRGFKTLLKRVLPTYTPLQQR